MKYVYKASAWKGGNNYCLQSVICTDYIKAREAATLLMEYCYDYYGVHPSCFNEIVGTGPRKARLEFRRNYGYVAAWKAITNDFYTIHIDKIRLNNLDYLRRRL